MVTWTQNYDPMNNIFLSAVFAAIPILFFLLGLTVFKMKGILAAFISLCIAIGVAAFLYGMPFSKIVSAAILGILTGLWPIGYIVIMAVWLYNISVKTGKFTIIRSSIAGISKDQRLQLLLIGFSFNAFLEGAAGFGVPIAISGALLAELGFNPLFAASLCLIANAASGAFGAIGIPVIVGAQVGNLTPLELSRELGWILPLITFFVPFILVFIVDKWKGIKETLPALLVVSLTYTLSQLLVMVSIGPELANIIASLLSMGGLALFLRRWQPQNIFRFKAAAAINEDPKYSASAIISAWSPFYILTGVIVLWSLPFFKNLFTPQGVLAKTTLLFPMPNLHREVIKIPPIAAANSPYDAIYKLDIISATGTAIFVSALISILLAKNITMKEGLSLLVDTGKKFALPILTVCFILGFAFIANYSGISSTLGLALAKTGNLFPLFSPVLGWIGVFLTGSVVSNNALFGNLQAVTGSQIGVSSQLLIAANTSGGVMAKLISPQSVAIASAAVHQIGKESALFRMTIKYSTIFLIYVCIVTFLLSIF
ncbi:L-lactate permease [Bacillota bacterium Lsc_1132]